MTLVLMEMPWIETTLDQNDHEAIPTPNNIDSTSKNSRILIFYMEQHRRRGCFNFLVFLSLLFFPSLS